MKDIFTSIKERYEEVIGERINPLVKTTHQVEMRAALMNAMRPFCKDQHIADMLNKDRTTMLNAVRKHDVYYGTSHLYRTWHAAAESVVQEMIQDIPLEMKKPNKYAVPNERELEIIEKAMGILRTAKKTMTNELRENRKSQALQQPTDGSVGDDAEAVREREVPGVLPAE